MSEYDGVTVRIKHVRQARLCAKGARNYFAAHGVSWTDFLENGLPAEQVAAMNDPFADRALEMAMKEAKNV